MDVTIFFTNPHLPAQKRIVKSPLLSPHFAPEGQGRLSFSSFPFPRSFIGVDAR